MTISKLLELAFTSIASLLLMIGVASADLIKEIQDRGVLKVGMAESPPWQSPNPLSGIYEGFNVDLAERAADLMGVKLEVVPATWSTLIPGLSAKQYDVVFANLFATPKRALVVNFTEPYSTYGFHIVVNASSRLQSLDDLNSGDVTFVGMSGTVEESYPKELYPNAKVKGIATNDIATWIGEVASGQADAAFLDPGTFRILKTKNSTLGDKLRVLNGESDLVKPVGLAYAVHPENSHMLQFLNTFIKDFVRNGEHITLRDTWFEILAKRD
ncbi:MAG: ABC transporter substrate-binding protein [Paracoccaceae bacterium]|jgi:polar amino acid transport system substrate-binding protein|nr:ABC transporter substrate-binding protein [Paracoccaceae bacterium]